MTGDQPEDWAARADELDDTDAQNHGGRGLIGFARDHPGFVVTVLTATAFLVKVMFVAHGDTDVALALVAATGPAELLFGLAVTLFPSFALFVAVAAGIAAVVYRQRRLESLLLPGIAALGTVAFLVTAPLETVVIAAIVGGAVLGVWWVLLRAQGTRPLVGSLAIGGVAALAVSVAGPTMWLPPEEFSIADDPHGLTTFGYFVEEEGEWVTILADVPYDRLIRLRQDQIGDRHLCSLAKRDPLSLSVLQHFQASRGIQSGCGSTSSTTGTPSPQPSGDPP